MLSLASLSACGGNDTPAPEAAFTLQLLHISDADGSDTTALNSIASLAGLVAAADAGLDAEMRGKLDATMAALGAIVAAAEGGFAYDMMLAQGNAEGEALIMGGVNGLIDQTRSIERIVTALGLDGIAFEGSDSLDNPAAVFQ